MTECCEEHTQGIWHESRMVIDQPQRVSQCVSICVLRLVLSRRSHSRFLLDLCDHYSGTDHILRG